MNLPQIKNRYHCLKKLGGGDMSWTYLAKDQNNQEEVIVKELHPGFLDDWKIHELFEREIKTLNHLNHARIPQILDHFEDPQTGTMYLVTEKVKGQTLEEKMEGHWHPSEDEVKEIMKGLLELLIYLHGFNPPYIHRDIKPSNVMIDENNTVYLIDFGAVQGIIKPEGHSTIVGTFGFMAPEQYQGQPVPASDLYSTGVTAIFLLTGRSVSHLVADNLTLNFRPHTHCSSAFASWIEQMVSPVLAERFKDAQSALKALSQESLQNTDHMLTKTSKNGKISWKPGKMKITLHPPFSLKLVSLGWAAIGLFEGLLAHSFMIAAQDNAHTWMGSLAMFIFFSPFLLTSFLLILSSACLWGLQTKLTLTEGEHILEQAIWGGVKWTKTGTLSEILDSQYYLKNSPLESQSFSSIELATYMRRTQLFGLGKYTPHENKLNYQARLFLAKDQALKSNLIG